MGTLLPNPLFKYLGLLRGPRTVTVTRPYDGFSSLPHRQDFACIYIYSPLSPSLTPDNNTLRPTADVL